MICPRSITVDLTTNLGGSDQPHQGGLSSNTFHILGRFLSELMIFVLHYPSSIRPLRLSLSPYVEINHGKRKYRELAAGGETLALATRNQMQ